MATFNVLADLTVNLSAVIEAETAEKAEEIAKERSLEEWGVQVSGNYDGTEVLVHTVDNI